MKYLIAILIPPVAVVDCGTVLPGIVNATLWAASCVLLLVSLLLFLFFGTSVALFVSASAVLWLAASTHAVLTVNRRAEELRRQMESRQLEQQIMLMRKAADRLALARETKSPT
jgi:uncharacterized protein YlxW (UPF0749 family)